MAPAGGYNKRLFMENDKLLSSFICDSKIVRDLHHLSSVLKQMRLEKTSCNSEKYRGRNTYAEGEMRGDQTG